ncbi:CBS domain-containing protein [Bacillus testis]|uniref:CBS domain-containing protein n=1 Tax=Bacillus testis TaxID=1622072 RepID=UPI00067F466B|nr:CBS domain-containing protein [Bacillus testis]
MFVKDFMIKDVVCAHLDMTLKDLLKKMIDCKIGGMPVVDANGTLVGMVSDGDILRHLAPQKQSVYDFFTMITYIPEKKLDTTVSERMNETVETILANRKIITLSPDDDLNEVVATISKHHFKKIPVIDENEKVIGVISRGDVLRMIYQGIIENL